MSSIAHKKTPTIDFENIVKCQQKRGAWSAYAQSKLALMMVVKELSCIHNNITFVSVHPGAVRVFTYYNIITGVYTSGIQCCAIGSVMSSVRGMLDTD